jgi:hypothetical protein
MRTKKRLNTTVLDLPRKMRVVEIKTADNVDSTTLGSLENKSQSDSHYGRTCVSAFVCVVLSYAGRDTPPSTGAVPWLKWLVAGLSPQRPGFAPGSIHVGFAVEKWCWDKFFSESFCFTLSISFHRRYPNSYHLGDEQYSISGSSSET